MRQGTDASNWQADAVDAYCARCGATVAGQDMSGQGCPFCVGKSLAWHRVVRLSSYQPPISQAIVQMKFHGQWSVADELGLALGRQMDIAGGDQPTVIVPVPMHWLRQWRRGFNQADRMARAVARVTGSLYAPMLRRTRYCPPQTHVQPTQRHANAARSVALRDRITLRGRQVVLVDDVVTSHATASVCARVLREAGAVTVTLAVAAVADPSGQDFSFV